MKAALKLTQGYFESSSSRTPEYLSWHRKFKKEFLKFLSRKGAVGVVFSKPNHFDLSGFFTDSNTNQIWYFSVGDIRWSKDAMLIRTVSSYLVSTGGDNRYLPLTKSEAEFEDAFNQIVIQK